MNNVTIVIIIFTLETKALKDDVTLQSLSIADGGVLYFKDLGMI